MIPIKFKGFNVVLGANQPEYQPLPGMQMSDGDIITCWQLTDEELNEVKRTGVLYITQRTFNKPMQPIFPHVNLEDAASLE